MSEILELAAEAGAAYVTGIALHLRGEVKALWFEWLHEHRPDLIPAYERLYRRGAYMPAEERRRLAGLVRGPDLDPEARMRGRLGPRRQPTPAREFGHEGAGNSREHGETSEQHAQGRLF